MELEGLDKKVIWDMASEAGLALGVTTCVIFLLQSVTSFESASVALNLTGSVLGLLLWAAKFFGCIWLMKFFMKKLCLENPGADNIDTRRMGIAAAALSAIICAAFQLAYANFINPELYSEAMDTAISSYSNMLTSDEVSKLEELKGSLGNISFFTNLIYCFVYGWILSLILSKNIPSQNPFERDNTDNQ